MIINNNNSNADIKISPRAAIQEPSWSPDDAYHTATLRTNIIQ